MVAQNPPDGGKVNIYKLDALTFFKLKAIVDRNNSMLREMREEAERKDRIIKELTVDRFCLAYLENIQATEGKHSNK